MGLTPWKGTKIICILYEIISKTRVGLITQREWPTENSYRTIYFKTVLGLILQTEAHFLFESKKGWVLHSNRGPCECVILNLKGKNQETLILTF